MAWTTPKTWAVNDILTSADLNTYVRDNFNETCPASVSAAWDMVFADGNNSMGNKLALGNAQHVLFSTGTVADWRFFGSRRVGPSNTAPTSLDTWTDWGTQTIRLTNPEDSVDFQVVAWVSGYATCSGSGAGNNYGWRARLAISFDDGSTWDTSDSIQAEMVDTAGYRRLPISLAHRSSGTVTTAIVVKAQVYEEDTGDTAGSITFTNGNLVANVVPD